MRTNNQVALLLLAATAIVGAQGQDIQFYQKGLFDNRFYGCVTNATTTYFCTNGKCLTGNPTNSSQGVCSNNFKNDYANPSFPTTYNTSVSIDFLDIRPVKFTGVSTNWLVLKQGETARINVRSVAEKSAYINLVYNDPNQMKKDEGRTVLFYVFNNRLKNERKFDQTHVDTVLLPQSNDNFTVYLAA